MCNNSLVVIVFNKPRQYVSSSYGLIKVAFVYLNNLIFPTTFKFGKLQT